MQMTSRSQSELIEGELPLWYHDRLFVLLFVPKLGARAAVSGQMSSEEVQRTVRTCVFRQRRQESRIVVDSWTDFAVG